MLKRLYAALTAYACLALLAALTLGGNIRLASFIFLGGLALRTYLAYLAKK